MDKHSPRHGSLQFWPRKRVKRIIPRIRSWPDSDKQGLLGFPGYKVGMSHVYVVDNGKHSITKGQEIFVPVTVIEVPAIKIYSVRFYKQTPINIYVYNDIMLNQDSLLFRTLKLPKKDMLNTNVAKLNEMEKELDAIYDIRVLVMTQPSKTGIGKKKPEIVEIALGGSINDKFAFVKEHIGKEITIFDVLKAGNVVDVHGVTKGKGYQGPVRRFGIGLKNHKSEKGVRRPGSLGAWTPSRVDFHAPMAGQTGYHLRTEYNKQILAVHDDVSLIQPKSGFNKYGVLKNPYVLVKGSIMGHFKRTVVMTRSIRKASDFEVPEIVYYYK